MNYDAKKIQEGLFLTGHYPGKIDGIMGPNTQAGIRSFQKAVGLQADGTVGPKTAAKLAEELGKASVRSASLKGYFSGSGSSAASDM